MTHLRDSPANTIHPPDPHVSDHRHPKWRVSLIGDNVFVAIEMESRAEIDAAAYWRSVGYPTIARLALTWGAPCALNEQVPRKESEYVHTAVGTETTN